MKRWCPGDLLLNVEKRFSNMTLAGEVIFKFVFRTCKCELECYLRKNQTKGLNQRVFVTDSSPAANLVN